MKFRDRFFSIILLIMMVFNICKYQIPHLEYGLFKGYIAKNLCVKRNTQNNCCQGKCFLKKQIKQTAENEGANGRNNPKSSHKKGHNLDGNEFIVFNVALLNAIEMTKLRFFSSETFISPQFVSDVFVPPKQLS